MRTSLKPLLKRLSALLAALSLLALAAADWCVHQSRRWQQAQAARLHPLVAASILSLGNAAADVTDALGVTGTDVAAPLPANLATNRILLAGQPRRLPQSPSPDDVVVLNKTGFTVGYSPSLRHPVWVAYRVHEVTNALPPPRPSEFKPDASAPRSPLHRDYAKSGYDRGHMAPNLAIATRFGKGAQAQTFLMSNICPQRAGLNQGPWCNLEYRISELWPDVYGDVWVITGAVSSPDGKRLPSGVDIPKAFYQIAVTLKQGRLLAFAVYMPQHIRRREHVRTTLVSIDEIETLTGLDFLAELPDDVEKRLEAGVPTRLWPAGLIGAAKLLRERFRTYD